MYIHILKRSIKTTNNNTAYKITHPHTPTHTTQHNLFIYCWLIAQSSAQGHLRAFHKFKFRTQVEYNTKHAHYINVKHTNIIRKVVPSVSLS